MDIDTASSPQTQRGIPSKKGRRAKEQDIDIDIVDKDETRKSSTSISNDEEGKSGGGDGGGGEAGPGAKQGWGAESQGGRTSASRRTRENSFFDTKTKSAASQKRTVVGASADNADGIADLMDEIPDMMDMAAEQVDIAAAPIIRSSNMAKTVEELENEMNNSSYTINQMQIATIQGFDLSLLISNAMVPIEQLEEEDAKWEWDVIFNQIANATPAAEATK